MFHRPTAYPYKEHSTKHPNLYHYYFILLPHLLPYIIPSYSLTLTPSDLPRDSIRVTPSSRKTGVLSSHPVFNPGMIPINDPTEDPNAVITSQLYNYINLLFSNTTHTPYITILYSAPIMTLAPHPFYNITTITHAPTQSPHKLFDPMVVLS